METPYDGDLELSSAQQDLLLALQVAPISTPDAVERGMVEAAVQLKTAGLVEWIAGIGWKLTPDGASLAKRIGPSKDEQPRSADEQRAGGD